MSTVELGNLGTISTEEAVTAVYIGYYNRSPDPVGLDFWVGDINDGTMTLATTGDTFAGEDETTDLYPFFLDPASADTAEITAFLNSVYLNLFNRPIDQEGIDFWVPIMEASVAGEEGSLSVGQIIVEILKGAKNSEDGQDLTVLQNKIAVGLDWAESARANADLDYENNVDAQAAASGAIAGVTEDQSTVDAAKAATADFFKPAPVPGETFSFTSATDNLTGTENDDTFEGYLQQNPFAGGVSNGLSSADRADGGEGNDSLYAELVSEFVGGASGTSENIDVQPRITNIESLEFEARDIASNSPFNLDLQDLAATLGYTFGAGTPAAGLVTEANIALVLDGWQRDIVVDAKNIKGHDFLGSTFSDGDLMIENVTTLDSNDAVRNTGDLTIGMDHTDNANSDGDASDLVVYFDEDYLISGQAAEGKVFYFLLDEDAELAGNPNRLNNIDVDGLRFNITNADGSVTAVNIEAIEANLAGTHAGFVAALQAPLQALIADGTLPAGTTLTLDPTITDVTFLDDGSQSADIPAMVLTSGDGSVVEATGFSRIQEEIGEYDVYGRFESINEVEDQPVSINIDLYKAGRGGEGGNLVIGGKDQSEEGDGIEVFNINVKGDGDTAVVDQPSNLGTITSTNNALRVVNIVTDPMYADKESVASLTVRNGFNELYDGDSGLGNESGDLELVDANGFLGGLNLGTVEDIVNLDMLTAMGGGDVNFNGAYNGFEDGQFYTVMTAEGDDTFDINIDGDAVDRVDEGFYMDMGNGDNTAFLSVTNDLPLGTVPNALFPGGPPGAPNSDGFDANGVSQLTTGRLMNLDAMAGSGDDYTELQGMGTWNIDLNGGSDTAYVNSGGGVAANDLWNTTGADLFAPVVLYKAELALSIAGFENVIDIDTGDNFILTQAELNDHLIEALDQNPEGKQLLALTIGTDDTNLLVQALIDGVNEAGFQIRQPELLVSPGPVTAGTAQVVLAPSDVAGMQRDLVAVGNSIDGTAIPSSATVATAAAIVGLFTDATVPAPVPGAFSVADDLFGNTTGADGYTGMVWTYISSALGNGGTTGPIVNNSILNLGTGANDLAILSANSNPTGRLPTDSQNTLVFDDLNAGKVSVVNWFDEATTATLLSNGSGAQVNGNHLLDFTAFLTNRSTDTGSSASSVYEGIEVIAPAASNVMEANSMHFVTVDALEAGLGGTTNLSFDAINAAAVKGVIESATAAGLVTYGAQVVSDGTTTGLVVGTTARTSIIAIENIDAEGGAGTLDNTNHGEYKFFQIIYGTGAETATSTVTVNEISVVDFGDSIDITPAILEANLVGTTTQNPDTTQVDNFIGT